MSAHQEALQSALDSDGLGLRAAVYTMPIEDRAQLADACQRIERIIDQETRPSGAETTMHTGIARAVEEADQHADIEAALDREMVCLWYDLFWARRMAHRNAWSNACEGIVGRITSLSRVLGRGTPWGQVPVTLLVEGVYQAVHDAIGVQVEPPDMTRVMDLHEQDQAQATRP